MAMMMANQTLFPVLLVYNPISSHNSLGGNSTTPILGQETKFRQVKDLSPEHMASNWHRWDLNLRSLTPDPAP